MKCDMKCDTHGTPLVRHPEDVELTTEPVNCPLCDAYCLWVEGGEMEVGETVGNALRMLTNIGLGLVEWRGAAD